MSVRSGHSNRSRAAPRSAACNMTASSLQLSITDGESPLTRATSAASATARAGSASWCNTAGATRHKASGSCCVSCEVGRTPAGDPDSARAIAPVIPTQWPVALRWPSDCQRSSRAMKSSASKSCFSTKLSARHNATAVSSLQPPRGRSYGPPPSMSPMGVKLPRRRNCVAAASASPTAMPTIAPR